MKKVLVFILFTVGAALAQSGIVLSPQSIVINPEPGFGVDVWVNKDPSGDSAPSYQIGENISISVRVDRASYIYLFNVRSNGVVDQILPNRFDGSGQNNYLSAGETKTFPPRGANYSFQVDGPSGLDKVIAVASTTQLNTRQLADFRNDPNFATSNIGEQGFAETLGIIITPNPQDSWVTDTALFYVGSRPQVERFGTLQISSSPSGAEAYVDGQFVGYTPVRYGTRSGSHTVELRQNGYLTYTTTVHLDGGQTLRLNPQLTLNNQGAVYFETNPRGAEIYVNGQFYGTTPSGAVNLKEGSYEVQFRSSGYPDAYLNFSVTRGESETVSAVLSNLNTTQTTLSRGFNLSLYPGAYLVELSEDDEEIEAVFEVNASLQAVFDDIDSQLFVSGWQRGYLEYKNNASKLKAGYYRAGKELELKLDKQGNSGRFKLDLELD